MAALRGWQTESIASDASIDPPARTWRRAGIDAAWVAGAFAVLPLVALLAPGGPAGSVARAERIVAAQREIGWLPEPGLIAWATDRPGLLSVLLAVYVFAHVPATVGAMVWAWLERPAAFPVVRNTFLTMQALVVAGYLLFPTATPRMLLAPEDARGLATGTDPAASLIQSPFAAMPSGHVAFAVFAAGVVAALARPLVVRLGVLLYPPAVVLITMLTANHFWLDAAAGAACTAAAAGAVLGLRTVQRHREASAARPLSRVTRPRTYEAG